jgi:hypothetical protein
MLSNSLETPGVFNRPPNATSSFKSPVSTFTASQSPILNHVSETPKIISMEEQKRNKSINDGLLELRMAPKLSQKQRKKLVASERSGVVEQTPQVAVKKAGSPWGSTSKSKSFIDFGSIQSEQKQKAVVETSIPESPSKYI